MKLPINQREARLTVEAAKDQASEGIKCTKTLLHIIRDLERKVDLLLKHCPDMECERCSRILCPYHDPLHFHHDGCPACYKNSDGKIIG